MSDLVLDRTITEWNQRWDWPDMRGYEVVHEKPVHEMCAKMSRPTAVITGTTPITELVVPDADGTVYFRTGYTYSIDLNDWMTGEWDKMQVTPIPAGEAKPVWPSLKDGPTLWEEFTNGEIVMVTGVTTGATATVSSRPTIPGSIPNPYSSISTAPAPDAPELEGSLTDAQKALGRAVAKSWGNR